MLFSVILSFCFAAISLQSPLEKRSSSLQLAIKQNFPDPSFIQVGPTTYAFATNNGMQNVPMATSPDFVHWEVSAGHDAMPKVPMWSKGNVWAPDVFRLDDGSFVMYFTATSSKDTSKHCVGAATSKSVTGPYQPVEEFQVCQFEGGGAIDPSSFQDQDGTLFITYKIDGNNLGGGGPCGNANGQFKTPIMLQQVSEKDGTTLVGKPQEILDRGPYDGPYIEAPDLIRTKEGVYVLFFSSNCYNGPFYDTSYATSINGVHGPYEKSSKPLLVSGPDNGPLHSPGGATVGPAGQRIVFHNDVKPGDPSLRQMWTGRINISGRTVSIV